MMNCLLTFRSCIQGHARATAHFPELVLNGFVTRLGHTVGRLFQTFFPPMPEFQGRQVVTLHNQRDFLFFRRHRYVFASSCLVLQQFMLREWQTCRYAFRSPEKVALQEIGPRFTLKLRSIKKGLPAVKNLGAPSKPLEFDAGGDEDAMVKNAPEPGIAADEQPGPDRKAVVPPTEDEYVWIWNVSNADVSRLLYTNTSHSPSWRPPDGHSSCRRVPYEPPRLAGHGVFIEVPGFQTATSLAASEMFNSNFPAWRPHRSFHVSSMSLRSKLASYRVHGWCGDTAIPRGDFQCSRLLLHINREAIRS